MHQTQPEERLKVLLSTVWRRKNGLKPTTHLIHVHD
jgi:hypothetical protein